MPGAGRSSGASTTGPPRLFVYNDRSRTKLAVFTGRGPRAHFM